MATIAWLPPCLIGLALSWYLTGKAGRFRSEEGKTESLRLSLLGPFAPARYFVGPGRQLFLWGWVAAALGFVISAVLLLAAT